jgi:folate-binding protein YgfZ
MRRLNLYKLRSNVKLTDKSETYRVFALLGASLIEASGLEMIEGLTTQHSDRLMFIDPRSSKLGLRAIVSNRVKFDSFLGGPKALEDYDYWRLRYGIPESYKDMISEKSIILESGLDDLKAIDWNKGCYLGQELTTRIKHQGLVRKRLLPVTIEGPSIPSNSEITIEGKKIGTMYSSLKDRGIALLRLQGVKRALKEKISLEHDKSKLVPTIPAWIKGINIDE